MKLTSLQLENLNATLSICARTTRISGDPPPLEDGVQILAGTPVMWNTLSSYCGHYPPSTLDISGVINWLDQKTSKPPCRLDLEDEENALRYSEYTQMRSLKMVLRARRMMLG